MKHGVVFLILVLIGFSILKTIQLIPEYKKLKTYKEDLAEINKINYGLFNLQIWKKQALSVFENRISEFEISPKAYRQVEKELEKYLHGINKEYIESGKIFKNIFSDAEKNPNVNKVFLKLIKDNTAPQIKNLKIPQYIPGMAVELAQELKKQEPQLRDIMRDELKKILKDNDSTIYNDPRTTIFLKYGTTELLSANTEINKKITEAKRSIDLLIVWVFSCLVVSFLITWILIGVLGLVHAVTLMTFISIILLILGVNLPMIDIEAVLNSFTINVLGTDIGFDRQYVYYQSKSILDVTETMIRSKGIDLKIVGLLVLCFSLVFPLIKLVLTTSYLYSERLMNSKTVQKIIFYLGKWSMADVFVVAMFMAYIGFYGIITAQLGDIANNKGGFAVETINNSKLSPGALFFTTYCLMSIILGIVVNKKVKN